MTLERGERLRIVGAVLAEVGRARLKREYDLADRLDALALRLEHPELERMRGNDAA